MHTHTDMHKCTHTPAHTLTHPLTRSHTRSHTHPPTDTQSHSHTHTHVRTHKHTHARHIGLICLWVGAAVGSYLVHVDGFEYVWVVTGGLGFVVGYIVLSMV